MKPEYDKYLDEVNAAIDEMASKPLNPERARAMHDYLYIKKHYMEHAGHNPEKDEPRKSRYGGVSYA